MNGFLQQWWRVGGALGAGWVVLFVVSVILQGEPPTYADPIEDIRAHWSDNGQTYLVGDYVVGLGFAFMLLPFLVALRSLLGLAEGSVQMASRTAFAAGVIAIVFGAASAIFWGAIALGIDNLSDEALLAFMYASAYGSSGWSLALAVLVLSGSLVIFRTAVLWPWLAYLGAVTGVLAVLGPLGVLNHNPEDVFDVLGSISYVGGALWILLTGIAMFMKKEEPVARAARSSVLT
jgi:hypothetical protein